jgi:AcrR family transcriptional regulator
MMAPTSALARRERERDLVRATRALFDERGMQEAPVEEIAKAVGIARGLIYRQFASKEELYVFTVTDYLTELDEVLVAAIDDAAEPAVRLEQWARAYAGFCLEYPAFLDCALSLMRRPSAELRALLSDSVWLRLGQGIAACVAHVSAIVTALGAERPDYLANVLWTQVLGVTHLARSGVGIRQAAPAVPELFAVAPADVVETCVRSARALVGAG